MLVRTLLLQYQDLFVLSFDTFIEPWLEAVQVRLEASDNGESGIEPNTVWFYCFKKPVHMRLISKLSFTSI